MLDILVSPNPAISIDLGNSLSRFYGKIDLNSNQLSSLKPQPEVDASSGHAGWVPDPPCRGTFGIASLYFATGTLICIRSSIHRDIPLERLSTFCSPLRDAPLVLVALFAPELMFYFALSLICARNVVKFASDLQSFKVPTNKGGISPSDQAEDIESSAFGAQSSNIPRGEIIRRNIMIFTLAHGFYATMGGSTFTRPDVLKRFLTFAHGLFTLSSYAMWWSKPLGISEPTWAPMGEERAREASALLIISDIPH
ncbi:hypothetical protein SCHPADRAFT_928105 [Schizopora paradoxa]|uniref:Uncharacterized protein n=1 Tax=Schizopora paradoxa TaxID=27342 RepID=A0A0H2SAZ9_9AGAM|nr:hypothetical protein SCHPADRAFT_928105 [Schizopora paradoxa]